MITPKERQAFDWVSTFIDTQGRAPVLKEIAWGLGGISTGRAHQLITALIRCRLLKRGPNNRGLIVLAQDLTETACSECGAPQLLAIKKDPA